MELKYQFVQWLLTPKSEREEHTMSAWAAAHDVSRQTLWEWKHDDEVVALIKRWKEMFEPVWASAMGTLGEVATDKDHPAVVQAIRTLGELMEKFPDRKVHVDGEIRHSVTGLYQVAAESIEGEYREEADESP